jgi:hypothetical protein
MKRILLTIFFLFLFLSQLQSQEIIKDSDVRLKENNWLRIKKSFNRIFTPEEWYRDDKEFAAKYKERMKRIGKNENINMLFVQVQALRYCKATTLGDSGDTNEQAALLTIWAIGKVRQEGREDEANKMREKAKAKNPNFEEYEDLFLFPKYSCDYRMKVYTSFFDENENEIATDSQFLTAGEIAEGKRKYEIIPGEMKTIGFHVPEKARYWQTWVPK